MIYIIDFDSTFIKLEALDELAKIALAEKPDKGTLVAKIEEITKLGMEGKISFPDSLERRLQLFKANKEDIQKLITHLQRNITNSVIRNKQFFLDNSENVYIISGGFKEYISPIVQDFGIRENHILANQFLFNEGGEVVGFNKDLPLAKEKGKVKQMQILELKDDVLVIGDGATDYHIKEARLAKYFIAFIENIKRESVIKNADFVVSSFDEIIEFKF